MNIQKAYGLLGHWNEESTRKITKQLQEVITHGKRKPCEHCSKSKVNQNKVCKESTAPKEKHPGGRVYLDLFKATVSRDDGSDFDLNKNHGKSIVDKRTGKK